jgi:hypothetical protein
VAAVVCQGRGAPRPTADQRTPGCCQGERGRGAAHNTTEEPAPPTHPPRLPSGVAGRPGAQNPSRTRRRTATRAGVASDRVPDPDDLGEPRGQQFPDDPPS